MIVWSGVDHLTAHVEQRADVPHRAVATARS
jgi:hypothetical protein